MKDSFYVLGNWSLVSESDVQNDYFKSLEYGYYLLEGKHDW